MKTSNADDGRSWRWRFVRAVAAGEQSFAVLCRQHGFSRSTGYKYWRRYQAEGEAGLVPRSRAPHRHGRSRAAHWHQRVRELRRQHPQWGPKKLRAVLPGRTRPAAATIGRWLRRMDWSARRRPRPRRGPGQVRRPLTRARFSNHVWTVDFKGSFCTAEGTRLHPLTVRDLFSRYVLCVRAWPYQREAPVRRLLARLFARHGRPKVIRCDHGVPWASAGPLSLTRLSVWWWRLGIRVEFTAKGRPEDNAAHEQHHRILKADTLRPPAATPGAQQQRFQRWRHYYNRQRPHEALGQGRPADLYRPSVRRDAPLRPASTGTVRRVHPNGEIMWEGRRRFLSEAVAGETVTLRRHADGVWSVRFLHLELGHLHRADPGAMRPASYLS